MPRYPLWAVGTDITAQRLAEMEPDIYPKESTETISNDAVLSNDAELVNIPLGVGRWMVKFLLVFSNSSSATPDLKTRWAFTGTWNSPLRACKGPAPSNTAAPDAITPVRFGLVATNQDVVYGTASGSAFYFAEEECFRVIVTVAGTLSLQWAQNTATVANTNLHDYSTCSVRQIAS